MKRKEMSARVRLIAEKRHQLHEAAREAARTDLFQYSRDQAAATLEVRAIEYAAVVQRYIGGNT